MENSMYSPEDNGQHFSSGSPRLPESILRKIQQTDTLLKEIRHDLGLSVFGGDALPLLEKPGRLVFKDEISSDPVDSRGIFIIRKGIQIAGVEMTQSTQYFNINRQSSGAGPDNSVPLVANKTLVLRVYVETRSGVGGYIPARVTGRVRFGGQEFAPLKGPVTPQDGRLLQRNNLEHTLNFRIPAALCRGTRTFEVRVFDVETTPFGSVGIYADGSAMEYSSAVETFAATFRDVPPIRVTGVMVNYVGAPNFNIPAPVGTDLVESLTRFLPMFPIHGFDFGPCTVMSWGDDMRITSGDKWSGWDSLLNEIANLRAASTIRSFYIALLPAKLSAQIGTTQLGIGRSGIAIAAKDNTRALSHELGHAMLLDHINAGGAPGPFDTEYPKWGGKFPFGSIGEFGMDTARMTLFNPAYASDLMTYLDANDVPFPAQTWISPYIYQRMMNALLQSDGTGDYPEGFKPSGQAMLLNFRLHRDGKVELLPSYSVTGITLPGSNRPSVQMMLDLIGRDGEVIHSHRCHLHNAYQDPDGPYLDFHEVLPWPEEVARVAVVRKGEPTQIIEVEDQEPEIQLEDLRRADQHGDLARLEWGTGTEGGAQRHAMIRYSHDDGQSWQAIAAGITAADYLVNLALLPGGERCRLQVVVSSGLRSATAQTEPFAVPHKSRRAYLVSPQKDEIFQAGAPVTFSGGGYSPDGGACSFDEVAWHSSLDGLLGTGYQLVRNDLRPGMHHITLTLPDGDCGEARAGVWIRITEESESPCK